MFDLFQNTCTWSITNIKKSKEGLNAYLSLKPKQLCILLEKNFDFIPLFAWSLKIMDMEIFNWFKVKCYNFKQ